MVRLLWERETEGKVFDSPERKATLDKALRQALGAIRDASIRRHYGEEIRAPRWQPWGRGGRRGRGGGAGAGGERRRLDPAALRRGDPRAALAALGAGWWHGAWA